MTSKKPTIIVGGFLGLINAGGAVWDYIQYPLGLHLMGYDVYYIEDTRLYPFYSDDWQNSEPTINRLKKIMDDFGLGDRWVYRDEVTNKIYGKTMQEYLEICKRAEIFINVSCANVMREEYLEIPNRLLIDSDPMFTQIQLISNQSFTSDKSELEELVALHTHHFTFGENINGSDCLIPKTSFKWQTTRQPVCLKYWKNEKTISSNAPFTTLMNWKAGKVLVFNGKEWGQKDLTFPLIKDLPFACKEETFKIAVSQTGAKKNFEDMESLKNKAWEIVSPEIASGNHLIYQAFINNSKGEISVAKETYVKAKTGWFSCRSACYLAAGRPVVTQDTAWSNYYPTGEGLFAFNHPSEAIDAIDAISSNWDFHSKRAREIAHEFFDYKLVLSNMLQSI